MSVASTLTSETLQDIVRRIVDVAQPERVILFGSHARGEADRYSDVDLLVIVPDSRNQQRVWDKVYDALRRFDVSNDVVVATRSEIARYGDLVGMVYRPALREGKVLYNAECGGAPNDTRATSGLEVQPVTESERLAETRKWLRQAEEDFAICDAVVQGTGLPPGPGCYHAQQAAEKALKAVLVYLQVQYPFTHDLTKIRRKIPLGWQLKQEFRGLKRLSEWAFKARYPGGWPDPTLTDAQRATAQARAIFDAVLRDLREHGFADDEA